MAKPKKIISKNVIENKFLCLKHGGDPVVKSNFYQSGNDNYKAIGIIPICKECIGKDYDDLLETYEDEEVAMFKLCEKYDIPFYFKVLEGSVKVAKTKNRKVYQSYMTQLNSFGSANGYGSCFVEGEKIDFSDDVDSNGNKIKKEKFDFNDLEKRIQFTEMDDKVKNDVIRLIGYDPFAGYSKFDQKFLYNEFMPFLDEDTLDDSFKLSQILQLVNNNNQIRKLDLVINNISANTATLLANHGEIKSLTAIKNQIVQSTDKIAKENSISVKNRGDKAAGKSTLTYMMKDYRELGFEDAEQDYYDQKKAYGMKIVADISNRSILDQLQLDENDFNDIIFTQRELIQNLQVKFDDIEEENRQLHEKISKLSSCDARGES